MLYSESRPSRSLRQLCGNGSVYDQFHKLERIQQHQITQLKMMTKVETSGQSSYDSLRLNLNEGRRFRIESFYLRTKRHRVPHTMCPGRYHDETDSFRKRWH